MEENTVVKVQTKDWANPTPAGLVAFAVACFCFFALLTGKVEPTALPLLGCWLIGGFVIQIVVGIVDLKGGNIAGGNVFLFFSGFFMLTGGFEMILKFNAIQAGNPLDARIDGYAWLVLFLVILLWTPGFCAKFSLLTIIIILLDVALPIISLTDLGILPKTLSPIAAWTLLACGIIAIYLSAAMVVNGVFGRKVYPLP
ncbi:MAG: GPR1/FUN34/YaaH family transporter [Clostridiales Family XIII bacterium]|jgi:succinate-acetate transporter protein|nr:GPR1/FUN34/YaaH family transporter [Clostridiales Family XIII bacterium]